jgi:hypothetical protein
LDPHAKLSGIFRWGINEQADELPLPLQSAVARLCGRLGFVPIPVAQRRDLLIVRPGHHLVFEALGRPDPQLTGEPVEVDDLAVGVVDLEDLLDALEGPMHTHTERVELRGAKGRPAELLVHGEEELVAKKVSTRPDGPEVRDRGHHVRYVAPLARALDRFGLDEVGPGEGERYAFVRRVDEGLEKLRVARGVGLA